MCRLRHGTRSHPLRLSILLPHPAELDLVATCTSLPLRAAVSENKATFVEMPLDELEQKYDKDWLQERVVKRPALKYHSVLFLFFN